MGFLPKKMLSRGKKMILRGLKMDFRVQKMVSMVQSGEEKTLAEEA